MSEENKQYDTLDLGDIPEFSEDDYLRFAQAKRIQFIRSVDAIAESPEALARLDPDRQANYLAAIRDIEKQVQVKQKMAQDERISSEQDSLIADMVLNFAKKANSQANVNKSMVKDVAEIIPDVNLIPTKQLIPGETMIGDPKENYQEWLKRTGRPDSEEGPSN